MRKIYCIKCKMYKEFVIKNYFFLVFVTSVEVKMKKYLKKNAQLKYQKFLV